MSKRVKTIKQKPGVMVYFEILECLKYLPLASVGQLFMVILEYAMTMREPVIPDELLVIWPMIRMRIQVDDQHYWDSVHAHAYAAYRRWAEKRGEEPMEYEVWLDSEGRDERDTPPSLMVC